MSKHSEVSVGLDVSKSKISVAVAEGGQGGNGGGFAGGFWVAASGLGRVSAAGAI